MTQLFQVVPFEHVKCLNQGRSLSPKAGFVNLITAIIRFDWLAHLCLEASEVVGGNEPANGLHIGTNAPGHWAFVKVIAGSHQTGVPVIPRAFGGQLFRADNLAESASKICLHENVADSRHFATGKKNPFRIWPLSKYWRARFDVLHSQFIDREAVCKFNRRLYYLGQRLCSELIECCDTSIQNGRNCCGERPSGRDEAWLCACHAWHICRSALCS